MFLTAIRDHLKGRPWSRHFHNGSDRYSLQLSLVRGAGAAVGAGGDDDVVAARVSCFRAQAATNEGCLWEIDIPEEEFKLRVRMTLVIHSAFPANVSCDAFWAFSGCRRTTPASQHPNL